jgi:hypothetical protein
MKQLSFQLQEKQSSNTTKQQKLETYESLYKNLDFILLPYAFLLGLKYSLRNPPHLISTNIIFELFSKRNNIDRNDVVQSAIDFFQSEGKLYKKDSRKALRGGNVLGANELMRIIVIGALEIKARHKSIGKLKKVFRKQLPNSEPPLVFAKIARYMNNGHHDENWYEETGKEIVSLFGRFDKELIVSLLSATSIRASLPSNVTKFYKVLNQFFEERVRPVLVGDRKKPKVINSFFSGELDATVHHLNAIKEGSWLSDPENRKKSGRKIKNFADAMLDNIFAIVADVWITRAFGCDRKRTFRSRTTSQSPTQAIYDAIEWYLQTIGELVNKTPRGLCATIWSGIRQEQSRGDTRYTDALKKRLDHGLFSGQYGALIAKRGEGITFEEL